MSIQANLTLNGLTVTNASNQFNLTDQGFTHNNASTRWTTILTNVQSLQTVEVNTSILNVSLLAEITRATTAESTLNASILAEITRATAAESTLNASILAEITRATASESSLNTSVLAEITRATTVENQLNASILAVSNVDSQLNASILAEITRATAAETTLTTNVSNVSSKITALSIPSSSTILSVNKMIVVKDPNASSYSTLDELGLTITDDVNTVTTINKSLLSFLNSSVFLTVNASGLSTTGDLTISSAVDRNIDIGTSLTTGDINLGNKSNTYNNNSQFLNGAFRSHITSYNTSSGKIISVAVGEIPTNSVFTEQTVYNYINTINTSTAIFKVNKATSGYVGYGTTIFELNINGTTAGSATLSGRLTFYIGQGDANSGVNFVSSVTALGSITGMTTSSITFAHTVGQTIINFVPSSNTVFFASLKSFGCREGGQLIITPQ